MRLWAYLKAKMRPHENKVAFQNSGITYKQLLDFENASQSSKRTLRICEGDTRERQALNIIRCIAEGDVAVPVSLEYGEYHYIQIKKAVAESDAEVDDLVFLMFTSGTTGMPKGVMLTDENIISNLEYISTYFKVDKAQKICIARPMMHISVLTGELLYALCNGLTIYFYEEPFMPKRLIHYCVSNQIDVFCSTPTVYAALAKADKERILPFRIGVISGEILTEEIGRFIGERFPNTEFYHVYGLTEHSPRISALLPDEFRKRPHSVGKPIGNIEVKVDAGELLVKSLSVMKGYYKDEKATFAKLHDGWLHTGDIVRIDEEGFYYIEGRKDGMIIRAGINIYPEQIEKTVKEYAEIEDCLVYEYVGGASGVQIGLKYVGDIDARELRGRLIKRLNPHIFPNKIDRVEGLPKMANGKKKRK